MRTPAHAATNPRPAFDPVRPLDVPSAPAPRSAPSALRKVRGVYKRGNYMERAGLLGTFVADPRQIERVTFHLHSPGADYPNGCTFALIVRNRWESWAGYLSPAQWEALRAHLPNAEYSSL